MGLRSTPVLVLDAQILGAGGAGRRRDDRQAGALRQTGLAPAKIITKPRGF